MSQQIDYEKYAQRFNFKNAASGKASWHALKKKLDKMADKATTVSELLNAL